MVVFKEIKALVSSSHIYKFSSLRTKPTSVVVCELKD